MRSTPEHEFGPGSGSEDIDDPWASGRFVTWDLDAEVECPHCGETVTIGLDPGGGPVQTYIEDCQVCCQPCRVRVRYDRDGEALVEVDAA